MKLPLLAGGLLALAACAGGMPDLSSHEARCLWLDGAIVKGERNLRDPIEFMGRTYTVDNAKHLYAGLCHDVPPTHTPL